MRRLLVVTACLLVGGCVGLSRGCSNWSARSFGGDWIVAQYRMDGTPFNCWQLRNVSITNEAQSDGIYWKDTATGHLVHISGWYNRVQVVGTNAFAPKQWEEAAKLVGVNLNQCGGGVYPMEPTK